MQIPSVIVFRVRILFLYGRGAGVRQSCLKCETRSHRHLAEHIIGQGHGYNILMLCISINAFRLLLWKGYTQ
jgi:hypothetical protein